jgi:hypothetical protein
MSFTTDQVINVWIAAGTWVSGLATTAAVIVSLWLVNRQNRVKIHATVGVRVYLSLGQPAKTLITLSVTNLGERPVRIDSASWKFPPAKIGYSFALLMFNGPGTVDFPKELVHGERSDFTYDDTTFSWTSWLLKDFPEARDERWVKRIRLHINTSVNQTVIIKPEGTLLDRIKKAAGPP